MISRSWRGTCFPARERRACSRGAEGSAAATRKGVRSDIGGHEREERMRALATTVGAALVAAALMVSAASAATPDAWITTKAKMALYTTEGVSGNAVNIDTVNGVVTLHGKVATAAEKSKAESTVK